MKQRAHSTIDKAAALRRRLARGRGEDEAQTARSDFPAPPSFAGRPDDTTARPLRHAAAAGEVERKYLRLAVIAARRADDLRGKDILVLDLRGIVDYTDFAVIATANNATHIRGIGRDVEKTLRAENGPNPVRHGESRGAGGWTVWDYGDLVLHVFDPDARAHYRLEDLWRQAPKIDWQEDQHAACAAASASTTPGGEETMAKKPATPKKATPAVKKPAVKKAAAPKAAAAKKPVAVKAKAAPAKKAVVKKPAAAVKAVAKKPVAKKPAPAKKPAVAKKPAAAVKAVAKKPVAKKAAPAKKPAVAKPVAKKPAVKKPAAKKPAAKK